jgi:SUMO ligase MMS21 Smc5/6 complex component
VQTEVHRAAKLLELADTPIEISSQVQDHVRELAMKNSELETKLAAMKHEKKKLEAKLKRAEAAMPKLRMEVADVLQSEYEPTITQKALLKEAVGNGYGAQESGKRLLRLHAAEILEHIRRKAGHDNILKQMELGLTVSIDTNFDRNLECAMHACIHRSIDRSINRLR